MTTATKAASRLWSNSGLLQANEVGSRVPPDPTLSAWPAGRGVRPQIPQESLFLVVVQRARSDNESTVTSPDLRGVTTFERPSPARAP